MLLAPFGLCLLGAARHRLACRAGDLLLRALTATSVLPVGIELGRWQARLVSYLPQLPVEWAALTLALVAWRVACRQPMITGSELAALDGARGLLLVIAAGLETWVTPHRTVARRELTPPSMAVSGS